MTTPAVEPKRAIPIYDSVSRETHAVPDEHVIKAVNQAMGSLEIAAQLLQVPCSWLYEFRHQNSCLDELLKFWDDHRYEMVRQRIFEKAMEGHWEAIRIVRSEYSDNFVDMVNEAYPQEDDHASHTPVGQTKDTSQNISGTHSPETSNEDSSIAGVGQRSEGLDEPVEESSGSSTSSFMSALRALRVVGGESGESDGDGDAGPQEDSSSSRAG